MARLVVCPNSPTAWEIQLKPGSNSIGRGSANDFTIADPSVSGSHCQVVVDEGGTRIKDLGSTNGTFVNRACITEALLQSGQTIHVGGVEMIYYADGPLAGRAGPSVGTPRVLTAAAAPVARVVQPPPVLIVQEPVLPPPLVPPEPIRVNNKSQNCKSHPRTAGRFFCSHCQQYYCELCVNTRNAGGAVRKFCRHCGNECVAVRVQLARPAGPKGFFSRLPGALIYPFRGSGLLILIASTLVFAFLGFISAGLISILAKIVALGYLFSFMQNIIHATTNQEEEMPDLPGFDDVFGGALRLAGTVIISFFLALVLAGLKFFSEIQVPNVALAAAIIFGCLYFPMAFLAVAMKDSLAAANPLVVVSAISKVPLGYLVAALTVVGVFGLRQLGDLTMMFLRAEGYSTHSMNVLLMTFGIRVFWSFAGLYLLTVSMRILGLLYLTNKDRFGWFER